MVAIRILCPRTRISDGSETIAPSSRFMPTLYWVSGTEMLIRIERDVIDEEQERLRNVCPLGSCLEVAQAERLYIWRGSLKLLQVEKSKVCGLRTRTTCTQQGYTRSFPLLEYIISLDCVYRRPISPIMSDEVAATARVNAPDPILLTLFANRFMSVAEAMGRSLQQTSISTNIKERLDFSCALFAPDGDLVANAPFIPIHLGSMSL
jgi:hypothetical protein